MAQIGVIIVAGGSGSRCGGGLPKQFQFLGQQPLLVHTINRFAEALPEAELVVVLPQAHIDLWQNLSARFPVAKHSVVAGGTERFYSVQHGLEALSEGVTMIAVQDGVRPLGSVAMIQRVVALAEQTGAAIPVVVPVDSFRTVSGEGSCPIDRNGLRVVQTPQVFRAEVLKAAYSVAFCPQFTDDASVVEAQGHPIALAEGERSNIKITTPEDFLLAQALLEAKQRDE